MLLTDKENVIVCISEEIEETEGGFVDTTKHILYPKYLEVILHKNVIVPEYVSSYKYKYVDTDFVVNETYQEPFDAEATVRQQQKIIDQLLIDSLMGV